MTEQTTQAALTFAPIAVPRDAHDLAAGDFSDFRTAIEVRNQVGALTRGIDAVAVTPEQSLPQWHTTEEDVHGWIVRLGHAVVGRAMLYIPLERGSRRAELRVEVLPQYGGRGIGTRALEFLEGRAHKRGRDILQSWTDHPARDGAAIPARTAFGSVPRDAASALLENAGYVLEQVYRISTLELDRSRAATAEMHADAVRAATGYRYVWWMAPTPDQWIDDYAWMKSRMSTDAPAGEAVVDEETWDADRVRRMEARNAGSGMTTLIGAAQHVASGRLVAFTELVTMGAPPAPIDQHDTLVLSEHRGHRLGALIKTETLALARDVFGGFDRVVTGNAEENRPMLAINESMGFAPTRYSGEWQKTVSGGGISACADSVGSSATSGS